MSENRKPAALILADGTVYRGVNFGTAGTVFGVIVFTTGVSGFQETLTDPSNFGQIVVQTFPSVGGYGVNNDDYASDRCHLSGYVVRNVTKLPSNYKMTESLGQFTAEQGVVGIEGVDTRAITRHVRDFGSMNAMISTEHLEPTAEVLGRNPLLEDGARCGKRSLRRGRVPGQGGEAACLHGGFRPQKRLGGCP